MFPADATSFFLGRHVSPGPGHRQTPTRHSSLKPRCLPAFPWPVSNGNTSPNRDNRLVIPEPMDYHQVWWSFTLLNVSLTPLMGSADRSGVSSPSRADLNPINSSTASVWHKTLPTIEIHPATTVVPASVDFTNHEIKNKGKARWP